MARRRSADALLLPPLLIVMALAIGVLAALFWRLPLGDVLSVALAAETLNALRLSLVSSLGALAVAAALGLPVAWLLARRPVPARWLVETVLDLPMIMPPLVAGLGLLFLFGRRGWGPALETVGIDVLFTPLGVMVAQAFVAVTVVIRTATAAFRAVDPRLIEVATTLRAGGWDVFWSVEVPLAAPGLVAGAVIAWARALGEFGATLLLAGATRFRTETLPIAIYLNIETGEVGVAVACAWILLVVGFVLLAALRFLGRSDWLV